jgi:mRNA interferase YafQ
MMRTTIERLSGFKRDYKREAKTYRQDLDNLLMDVLAFLLADVNLPIKYQDHKLAGNWEGCRECHIRPNLLLVYEKPDDNTLRLVRLGSHAELFGM